VSLDLNQESMIVSNGARSTSGAKDMPQVSVVIPTFGRGSVLEKNVAHIRDVLMDDQEYGHSFELIIVDDNSPDDTAAVVRSICSRWADVHALLLAANVGQQNATLAGLRRAVGQAVITMDDDMKDDPKDIRLLLDQLKRGFDVVYGIPDCSPHTQWHRHLGTSFKEWIIARACRKPKHVRLTGFRAMTRETVNRITRETRRHVYISATILQEPVRIGQVTVHAGSCGPASSGYSMEKLARLVLRLVVQYGKHPLFRYFRKPGRQYEILEEIS